MIAALRAASLSVRRTVAPPVAPPCHRRARPALGTLVEVGAIASAAEAAVAFEAAWAALGAVERACSAFDPQSDVGRFNAAPAGSELRVAADTCTVLRAAALLWRESLGRFDVTLGSGPQDWSLGDDGVLCKHGAQVRLDLGGIAKGHAVDRAFEALRDALPAGNAACWVNAGGDLRAGALDLPVHLRDERDGGARPFLLLRDGALATSHYGPGARSRLAGSPSSAASQNEIGAPHVSVAAPRCLWADALTKVVALSGAACLPLLASHGATPFFHA